MKKTNANEEDVIFAFFKELNKMSDNQRLLVIVTHGFVELLLNTIIDVKCKHGKKKITSNHRDYPHAVKLVLLNELNLLDDRLYRILDWFNKVQNRAAHEPFFQLTAGDIALLTQSLDRFISGESNRKPNNLYHFCTLLIGTIWNENLQLLLPKFAPNLIQK